MTRTPSRERALLCGIRREGVRCVFVRIVLSVRLKMTGGYLDDTCSFPTVIFAGAERQIFSIQVRQFYNICTLRPINLEPSQRINFL